MKAAKGYVLKGLGDSTFLLPYGQCIIENRRSLKINKTGAFIWSFLQNEHTLDEIVDAVIMEYNLSIKEANEIASSVSDFLNLLRKRNMLIENNYTILESYEYSCTFNIAETLINYYGPKDMLHSYLPDFLACNNNNSNNYENNNNDIQWSIYKNANNAVFEGEVLIKDCQLTILKQSNSYYILMHNNICINHIIVNDNKISFYCNDFANEVMEMAILELSNAFRFSLLILLQKRGFYALHSASILYKNKAWLFCAPSGTGKSTHTNMWNSLFNTVIINGDINLCTIKNGKALIYGIPWCGTSGIYSKSVYEIGGIVMLSRSNSDYVEELNAEAKVIGITQRLISPAWTEEMLLNNINFTTQLITPCKVVRLHCTKNENSVYVMKEYMDQ